MKKLLILVACLLAAVPAAAKIELSGAVRNDGYLWVNGEQTEYINVLENKLLLQRKADKWKFYTDLRFSLYSSDLLESSLSLPEGIELIDTALLRAFVKYYSPVGDITIGKTYVNFGNAGVFNPFELDQGLNVTDLNYTKEGLIAVSLDYPINALSSGKVFVSPESEDGDASFGAGAVVNAGSFDVGIAGHHTGRDLNTVGIYFKGDLEVGVQGSLAHHMNDQGEPSYTEAVVGIDYSFLDSKLILGCQGYYNGHGQETPAGNASFLNVSSTAQSTDAFPGRYYLYAYATYAVDEFLQYRIDGLVHTRDSSSLLIPSASIIIADGLTFTGQCIIPTGSGDDVYSRDVYGDIIIMARIEAKL